VPEVLNKDKLLEQARVLADQGKLDRAIQEYQKVLHMDPKDLRLKLRIAELYAKQKKMNEAIQTYQQVADAYCDGAFYLKAVTVYKNILRLNPSLLDVNRKLAELYEKMGLVTDAIHQYQIVANMMEQKGMDAELLEVRRKIVAIAPDTSMHRIRLAEAYQLCGEEDSALNEYEVLVKQLTHSGTPEQLIELYEKILAHRPDNLEMVRALCATYSKVGEWKKALKRMEVSQNLVLQDPELLTQMAEYYARQNQMATAAEKYGDLAELYMTRQELDHAISAYAASVVYSPEEEAHIRELVEQLAPDAGPKFAKAVEARRAWLAKAEAEAEAADAARMAAEEVAKSAPANTVTKGPAGAASPSASMPATPKVTVVDVKTLRRQVESALQLAQTYQQMSLMDEAKDELQKADAAYATILRGGADDAALKARLEACRSQLTAPPTKSVAPSPTAAPAAPQRPAGSRIAAQDPKKKRISFV
jgi:tetratricopeptide (TPR) repeat protein